MSVVSGNTMKAYREKTGATPSEALRTLRKRQAVETSKILGALKVGPRTIPELVAATALPSRLVVWYVMSFCRDKLLKPLDKTPDGFYRYAITTKEGR
ncbi:MAG TPA: hypothetical protein VEY12_05535 [Thermoplasmata archaeon]|nr:hypothetical protein [Thermoplasmata archaeon]